MLAKAEGVTLAHDDAVVGIVGAKEVLHHAEGLFGGDYTCFRVDLHKVVDIGGMVRLHVLDHQIVGLTALQGLLDIVQPLMGKILVHGVHDGDLLVQNGVRVVGHAVGDDVLSFKQVYLMVVYADVFDVVGDGHKWLPLS